MRPVKKDTLTVTRRDPRTRRNIELAKFTMDRHGRVTESYKDFRFRQEMRHGIRLAGRVFRPKDGPKFMNALEKAYRSSSLVSVQAS